MAPIGQITEENFGLQFDVNVKGLLFSLQKALPMMKEGGSIILNSSVAGSKGTPAFGVYAATKAAVRSFARSWTSDVKDRKIRVNALSPGPISTPIFGKIGLSEQQVQEFVANIVQSVPMGRSGTWSMGAKLARPALATRISRCGRIFLLRLQRDERDLSYSQRPTEHLY